MKMYQYLLLFGLLATAQESPREALSPEQIAAANAAGIDAIRSLIVQVTHYMDAPGFIPADERKRDSFTWYWAGDQQRVTLHTPRRKPAQPDQAKGTDQSKGSTNEATQQIVDRYNGTNGFRETVNCDPNDPPELSETENTGCHGVYGPRSTDNAVFAIQPKTALLMAVTEKQVSYSLTDLVRQAQRCRVSKLPAQSNFHCYELEIFRESADYTFYVDPSANFMIRRLDINRANESPLSKKGTRGFLEVDGFKDYGNGVFLPTGLHGSHTEISHNATAMITIEVDYKKVNEPLPQEVFEIKFVDWMRVKDNATGHMHLWGPDGKPRRTFESKDAYLSWYFSILAKKASGNSEGQSWVIVLVTTLLVLLLTGVVLRRLWYKRSNPPTQGTTP